MKEKISVTLDKGVIKNVDSVVDRLFIRNRSQAIETLLKKQLDRDKTAVILLGGDEKRLRIDEEYTPIIKIKGITLIERAIRKLRDNHFKEIFIVARKNILEAIFSILKTGLDYGVKIKYIEEKESAGSASSLRLVKKEINKTFLVIFGDILFDKIKIDNLWNFHIKNNSIATLSLITFDKPSIKGEIFLDGNKVIKFSQKPKKKIKRDYSYLVWCPICVCEPEMLQYSGGSLEEDIFPVLAKKDLLNGYVSAEREIHIHTKKDVENANKNPKIK